MAGKIVRAADFPWVPNPKLAGVMGKVVLGKADNPAYSTHLVRVEPGATIETHDHADAAETMYCIFGTGTCEMEGQQAPFIPGTCIYAPAGVAHSIHNSGTAPIELLCLFAPPTA